MWKQGSKPATPKPATRFRAVMRAVPVIRIGLCLAFSHSVPGWAATIFDVEKIMTAVPKVAGQANLLLLQGEKNFHPVRLDYLRTLAEARKRFGGVSKLSASLDFVVESKPNAYAIPLAGRNVILLSTGMLELIGQDSGMAAALLGKAYGHLYVKHSSRMVSNLPNPVYGPVAIGNNAGRQTGARHAAADAASTAFGLRGASFIREEVDAKKFFADPIMGFRGEATILKVPPSS